MQASQSALGVTPETFHQTNAFDQGYLQHIGIEPCTYGPGEESTPTPISTWRRSTAPATRRRSTRR